MPKYIMLHCTAVSYDKNSDQFEANNAYHKAKWNFKSSLGYYLGYNYEISKLGHVRQAREDGERTAACYQKDMNDGRCIHIALDGNFDQERPHPNQIFALRDLLKKLVKKHGINKKNIVFHRDYANKSCPGNNLDIGFVRSLVSPNIAEPTKKEEVIKAINELLRLVKEL